jgi:hypothetical protein
MKRLHQEIAMRAPRVVRDGHCKAVTAADYLALAAIASISIR